MASTHHPSPSTATASTVDHEGIFDDATDPPFFILSTETDIPGVDDGLSLTTDPETLSLQQREKEMVDLEHVDFYSLEANESDGSPFSFENLRGKYVIITNLASMCIMTWQVKFLEELNLKYKSKGVEVLGFPANDFFEEWMQSDTAGECYRRLFRCKFRIMQKVRVNGKKEHQVFKYLKDRKRGFLGSRRVKWNFEKFLIGRDGEIIERYSTFQTPKKIMQDLDRLLLAEEEAQAMEDKEEEELLNALENVTIAPSSLAQDTN